VCVDVCDPALVHSLVLFIQLVSLNVAINSRSNALLTLLISNNFVELKVCECMSYDHESRGATMHRVGVSLSLAVTVERVQEVRS
jgi:hypothetical protein